MENVRYTGLKRTVRLATGLMLIASAAACGNGGGSDGASETSAKSVGVQFCAETNAWCAAWIKTFTAEMDAAGVKTTVLTSNFDPAADNQHLGQLVAKKPDVLVMGLADGNAAIPAILRAAAAGVKLVNVVGPVPDAAQKSLTANVVVDNASLGRFAADNLIAGMKQAGYDKGNVVVLSGVQAAPTVQQTVDAFDKEMAKSPQYKIVSAQDTQWDPQKAQQMAAQLIAEYSSKGGIQGIYAQADYLAAGAIRAVKQADKPLGVATKDGVIVVASNCSAEGPALLRNGELYGTGTGAPAPEAEAAAKMVLSILKGETVAKDTLTKEESITQANVDDFVNVCTY